MFPSKTTELEVLFDQSQLWQLDNMITNQMSLYLDQNIANSLEEQLMKMAQMPMDIIEIDPKIANLKDLPAELAICAFVSKLTEDHESQIASKSNEIDNLKMSKVQFQLKFSNSESQRTQMQSKIDTLLRDLGQSQHDKGELMFKIYHLNDTILMQKEQIHSAFFQIMTMKRQLQQKSEKISELYEEMNEKNEESSKIIQCLTIKNRILEEQMTEIEAELQQEVESRRSNLITLNIEASQIDRKYEYSCSYWMKVNSIHGENSKIVSLLHSLQKNFTTYELGQIQEPSLHLQALQSLSSSYFENNSKIMDNLQKTLFLSGEKIQQLTQALTTCKKELKQAQQQSNLAQKKIESIDQQNEILKSDKEKLEFAIQTLTQNHYRVLIDLTQSKTKLERSLQEESQMLQETKKTMERTKDLLIKEQNKTKIFQERFEDQEKRSIELKSNLQSLKKVIEDFSSKPEDLNGSALDNIFKKNVEYLQEMQVLKTLSNETLLKNNMLKKQVSNYQTEISHLTDKEKALESQVQALKTQLSEVIIEKDKQIATLEQQLECIQVKINKNECSKTDNESQTEVMVRQSQIRRQKVLNKSQLKSQIERSHSLISEKGESKQNRPALSNKISQKIKIKQESASFGSCKGRECLHIQKISALNEIINFMMNYIKGYEGQGVRPNSWFSHQIAKHGNSYEARLRDEKHQISRIKNLRFIDDLCDKQTSCNKLLNEFQAIMNFYFLRLEPTQPQYDASLNSTIAKSRLNRTVHKLRVDQNSYKNEVYR